MDIVLVATHVLGLAIEELGVVQDGSFWNCFFSLRSTDQALSHMSTYLAIVLCVCSSAVIIFMRE